MTDNTNEMTFSEKSAYLKGLASGLDFNRESAEGRLIEALIDLCSGMAAAIDELDATIDEIDDDIVELNEYCDELDEDLGDVEEYLFDDEDGDDEDGDPCEGCPGCDGDDDAEPDDIRMMMCPHCNEEIYFEDSLDPKDITCPYCGKDVSEDTDGGED